MNTRVRAIIIAIGVGGLLSSAFAADMTGAEIKAFLSGKTAYLETTAASASGQTGQGVIYWATANGRSRKIRIALNGRSGRALDAYGMTRRETPLRSLTLPVEKAAPRL
jgi:hypothetical protein